MSLCECLQQLRWDKHLLLHRSQWLCACVFCCTLLLHTFPARNSRMFFLFRHPCFTSLQCLFHLRSEKGWLVIKLLFPKSAFSVLLKHVCKCASTFPVLWLNEEKLSKHWLEFMTKYLPGWGLLALEKQDDSQCFMANGGNVKSTQVSQKAPLQDYGPHLDKGNWQWHLGSYLQKKWVIPVNNRSGISWISWEDHVSHTLLLAATWFDRVQ